MGTKAVFAIKGYDDSIIGMTSDGFPNNLVWIAKELYRNAKKLKILTKLKRQDKEVIGILFNILVGDNPAWLFLDNPKNPSWVSYSAELDLKYGNLQQYEGYHDREISIEKIIS